MDVATQGTLAAPWEDEVMGARTTRKELLAQVVGALPAWQVLTVQYNDAIAAHLGVSSSDLQCLFVLSNHGPCTPGAIAQHIGLTTGSASRMVERLVTAQLVTREQDNHDRRRVVVTAKTEALDAIAQHYTPLNAKLRTQLETYDETTLRHILDFVTAAEAATQQLLHPSV